jgi:predicted phage tail protein
VPEQRVERIMIVETNSGNGGSIFLAFVLGAVLIGVGIVGFFMWDNYKSGGVHSAPAAIHVTVKK